MSAQNRKAARKKARILQQDDTVIVIKGDTMSGVKRFNFRTLSEVQQMRKRNSAYKFFSID